MNALLLALSLLTAATAEQPVQPSDATVPTGSAQSTTQPIQPSKATPTTVDYTTVMTDFRSIDKQYVSFNARVENPVAYEGRCYLDVMDNFDGTFPYLQLPQMRGSGVHKYPYFEVPCSFREPLTMLCFELGDRDGQCSMKFTVLGTMDATRRVFLVSELQARDQAGRVLRRVR